MTPTGNHRSEKIKRVAELKERLRAKMSPDDQAALDQLIDELTPAATPTNEQQRKWLESILDRMPIGLILIDPKNTTITFSNKIARKLIGIPIVGTVPSERHGVKVQAFHSSGRPLTAEEIPSVRAGRGEILEQEHFILKTPQGLHDLAATTDMISASHGHADTAVLLLQDITSVKSVEKALKGSEERYKLATLATRECIWDWDLVTGEVHWNEALVTELGHPDSARISDGTWWYEHIHPDDRERVVSGIHHAIDGTGSSWEDEYRFQRGDKSFAIIRDRGHLVRDDQGRGIRMIGAMQDMTREHEVFAQLQQREADFRSLAETMPQMLFVADLEGNITYYNQRWYDYVGASRETLGWGWNDKPIHHPDDLARTIATWKRALETGEPYQIEYRLRRHDGSYRWHLGRAVLMRDENGIPLKWFGTNTDIHDQRTLAEQLEMAVSAASLGFWDYQIGDASVRWSEQLRQHYGFPEGQHTGTLEEVFNRIHPDDRDHVTHAMLEAQARRKKYHIEFRIMPAPDQIRWLECMGNCFFDSHGRAVRMVGTSLDITEKRQAAEQLRSAKEAAESASELKSAFLANMSHEIRTPLGAIRGYAELLRDETIDPALSRQFVEIINRSGKALTRIIDDILDLSKVESGRLAIEATAFSPREVLNEVFDLFAGTARSKHIDLRQDFDEHVPDQIVSDPARFRQVVINLVGNALKFTDAGYVSVRLQAEQSSKERIGLTLLVKDTGIGMNQDEADRLFHPFTQLDPSSTRRYGGTGLGLALSRRLAHALDGDIKLIAAEPGGGATFAFHLIAGRVTQEQIKTQQQPQAPKEKDVLAGASVLLADDSPENQNLVAFVLARQGAKVETAANGIEAVEKALARSYDVVLMDIQMPALDGYGATRRLRQAGYRKPIIALTAHAMLEERKRTKEAGCDDHLTKPLDFAVLVETVRKYCRQ